MFYLFKNSVIYISASFYFFRLEKRNTSSLVRPLRELSNHGRVLYFRLRPRTCQTKHHQQGIWGNLTRRRSWSDWLVDLSGYVDDAGVNFSWANSCSAWSELRCAGVRKVGFLIYPQWQFHFIWNQLIQLYNQMFVYHSAPWLKHSYPTP